MASLTTDIIEQGPGRLRTAFSGVIAFLVLLAEASPRYRLLEEYSAMSDAQLAELGMTREDLVERVFGARIHF